MMDSTRRDFMRTAAGAPSHLNRLLERLSPSAAGGERDDPGRIVTSVDCRARVAERLSLGYGDLVVSDRGCLERGRMSASFFREVSRRNAVA
jgi:hypothetical protein